MKPDQLSVIDAHLHQWSLFSDPVAIERFFERTPEARCLVLASDLRGGYYPSEEEVAESNQSTLHMMKLFPGRVQGWCYVNPRWPSAVDELRRGFDAGLLGLKLWVATRCTDPLTLRVIEAAVDAGVPMLVHCYLKATGNLPQESTPDDVCARAQRYPEARILMAHFGAQWEHGLRSVRNCPNVWADFSGSVNEYGAYEMAVAELGPDRVVFGTDLPADFYVNLGRVLQGNWPRDVLDSILGRNFETMVGRKLI